MRTGIEAVESVIITPTEADIDQVRGYRIGTWYAASGQNDDEGHGIPGKPFNNYECIYCQYSTIFPKKMEKHQEAGVHVWAYPSASQVEVEEDDSDNPEY